MSNIQQILLKNCFSVRCLQFSSIVFNIHPKRHYCATVADKNPLLDIKQLPSYSKITGEIIEEAIPILIQDVEAKFSTFENELSKQTNYTWDGVVRKPDLISDKLSLAWSAINHLHAVKNNPPLRAAYQKVLPNVVFLTNKLSQSESLYKALLELQKRENLEEAQNRIIQSSLKSSRNSGVHLEGNKKEEFNIILQRLAELSSKFMNNVLDSTKAFSLIVEDKRDIEGLPSSLLQLMASSAGFHLNKTIDPSVGPWKVSLDMPCFEPFMKYSLNGKLRETLYRKYVTRASSGENSNAEIIEEIRMLRKKKADILGFKDYTELSLDTKMAKNILFVWNIIHDLKVKAKPVAEKELITLQRFATDNGFEGTLNHWDLAFWSERQKEKVFSLNEEELREYFPFPKVLKGLFTLAEELFQIHIKETDNKDIDVWHKDVQVFDIFSNNGDIIASFFLDAYSRPEEKNGGAWMDVALGKDDSLGRKPVAYLICNQSPPVGDKPSLMNFREVVTLFHEFGHGLQHMLTEVKYPGAAGINNVEWDAVELPSQFMENWLYDDSTISRVSSHYKTGEALPQPLFQKIRQGKNYHAGLNIMRQLYFSALDLELHLSDKPWREVMKRVADEYTIMKPLEEDSFPCSFLHIFSGGYAAGYYSYKWAEVLSADAFSAFEDVGLNNREKIAELGMKFRNTVLSLGGSKHPQDIFVEFRGRKPNVKALLKSYDLI